MTDLRSTTVTRPTSERRRMTDLRSTTVTRPASQVASDAPESQPVPPCAQQDDMRTRDAWFPNHGAHSVDRAVREEVYAEAKAGCARCSIRLACLDAKMADEGRAKARQRWGVAGGLDPYERADLAKRTGVKRKKPDVILAPHGTEAAYVRHVRAKDKACRLCVQAHHAHEADRYARARKKAAS